VFGLLVVKRVELGAIGPPVGLNAFVVKGMAPNVELRDLFYGCLPLVILELTIVAASSSSSRSLFAVSD
jgi:TRAP-type C4-dicarboxylate transport system permease large subunit